MMMTTPSTPHLSKHWPTTKLVSTGTSATAGTSTIFSSSSSFFESWELEATVLAAKWEGGAMR
jgi:hypothetical protein